MSPACLLKLLSSSVNMDPSLPLHAIRFDSTRPHASLLVLLTFRSIVGRLRNQAYGLDSNRPAVFTFLGIKLPSCEQSAQRRQTDADEALPSGPMQAEPYKSQHRRRSLGLPKDSRLFLSASALSSKGGDGPNHARARQSCRSRCQVEHGFCRCVAGRVGLSSPQHPTSNSPVVWTTSLGTEDACSGRGRDRTTKWRARCSSDDGDVVCSRGAFDLRASVFHASPLSGACFGRASA
ncbi:hypothetical protein BV20DRAFT_815441 [Pilatotrama ljubarskyi]|nr:hypothetical protein BV20DRAFT_815441 [Pilatotrama ljubarskyi]